jgi:hypothetical protein
LTKLASSNEATRNKAQAVFVQPLKIMIEQLKLLLQAQPVSLKTLPPDLTQLASRNKGVLPIWGPTFRALDSSDRSVAVRIGNVVEYLSTIQK